MWPQEWPVSATEATVVTVVPRGEWERFETRLDLSSLCAACLLLHTLVLALSAQEHSVSCWGGWREGERMVPKKEEGTLRGRNTAMQ